MTRGAGRTTHRMTGWPIRSGRFRLRRLRAAGSLVGLVLVLSGLAACSATPDVASLPTWPVSPELLPEATSAGTGARLTCGGRTFPATGLDAPTGAEEASGPEFDALRASLAKFGPAFPGSSTFTAQILGLTCVLGERQLLFRSLLLEVNIPDRVRVMHA